MRAGSVPSYQVSEDPAFALLPAPIPDSATATSFRDENSVTARIFERREAGRGAVRPLLENGGIWLGRNCLWRCETTSARARSIERDDLEGGGVDLLGMDLRGDLVAFEVKLSTNREDPVAQLLRYASSENGLGAWRTETLLRRYARYHHRLRGRPTSRQVHSASDFLAAELEAQGGRWDPDRPRAVHLIVLREACGYVERDVLAARQIGSPRIGVIEFQGFRSSDGENEFLDVNRRA